MCKDLETQAQDYAEWQTCDIDSDAVTVWMIKQMLAEAYKQGYKDALTIKSNKDDKQV